MTTRPVNGSAQGAAVNSPATRDPTDDAGWRVPKLGPELPDPAELCRALAAAQQQLEAARETVDALLEKGSLLQQKVVQLERSLVQARRLAYHDELTGLPNRRLLLDRFNQAVALATRLHKHVALLFLDLDDFKRINDRFGHPAGDRVLQQVAARLAACIRSSDTACRFGGDEFVILLPEFDGQESPLAVTEKLRAHLASPYVIDGNEISVMVSIGTAVYPVDGRECGDLVQVSDLAMFRNKTPTSAAPRGTESMRQARRRPWGVDSTEEQDHAAPNEETNPIGDDLRSRTGRSVQ